MFCTSSAKWMSTSGYWILTTTSRVSLLPSWYSGRSVPLYVCASDAAPRHLGSMCSKTSVMDLPVESWKTLAMTVKDRSGTSAKSGCSAA